MREVRAKFTVVLLFLGSLVFLSCNQSVAELATTSVSISIKGVYDSNARTLMPSSVTAPDHYKLTLQGVALQEDGETYKDNDISYRQTASGTTSTVSIPNVLVGTYRISLDGYDANGMKTLSGTPDGLLTVSPSGTNSASVLMEVVKDSGTGSLLVSFDWSDVAASSDIMKEALTQGPIKFALVVDGVSYGAKSNDDASVTSATFTWEALPASTGSLAYFRIMDSSGFVLCSNFASSILQVYAGQCSVPDSNEKTNGQGAYVVGSASLSATKNVYDVSYDYQEVEDPSTSLRVSWANQMTRDGVNLFSSVNIKCWETGGDEPTEPTASVTLSSTDEKGHAFMTGLFAGTAYSISIQAITNTGKRSTYDTYLTDAMAKIPVTSITIDEKNFLSVPASGESFTLSASVTPENATFKGYRWSVSDQNVLHNDGNTFTAYQPGKATITATSTDDEAVSDSTGQVSVILPTPSGVTLAAKTNGILVSWDSCDFAESYTLLKKTGDGDWNELCDVTGFSYQDSELKANTAYSYKVQAKADSLKDGDWDPKSAMSAETEAITPVLPTVNIQPAVIDTLSITLDHPEDMVILPTTEKLTVSLTGEIQGASGYNWYINDTLAKSGTWDNASYLDITLASDGISEDSIGGTNNLTLAVTKNGVTYSATTSFSVIDVLDTGVSVSVPSDILRLPTSEGTVQITSNVIPGNATRQDVTYASSDESVLAVSATGLVTLLADGQASVTVTPAYGEASVLDFDIYQATFAEAIDIVNAANAAIRPLLAAADTSFKSDWWPGEKASHYQNGSTYDIKSSENATQESGYIRLDNYAYSDKTVGAVTLTTTTEIKTFAKDGGNWAQAGYLGTDNLSTVGYGNQGDVSITLPHNQGVATIHYNAINVIDSTRSGSYTVTFSKTVGTDGYDPIQATTTVKDSGTVTPRLFN